MKRRPERLPLLLRLQTNLVRLPLFVGATVACGTVSLAVSLADRKGSLQHGIARAWAKISLLCSGAKLEVVNREALAGLSTVVFASNHTSYLDTPIIFSSLPVQFRILAKKELWPIPFIGWYLSRSGQLPIDTANPRATLSSLGNAVKTLKAGMSLFVFPEGGRTPDGELKTFLSGAAYIAIKAQVPLVPMALVGAFDLLPIHTRHFFPCKVKLVLGDPFPTEGMNIKQVEELNQLLFARVQALKDSAVL